MITTKSGATFDPGFDPEALRVRYAAERQARLARRADRAFVALTGELADYAEDPRADITDQRPLLDAEIGTLILGGGFTGLIMAARLREAGVDDFRILDNATDFGGTWYWNRYPGIRCDVESYIYLPLLEETGYMPSEKYARGGEILAHCQRIGRHYGLYEKAIFGRQLTSLVWDEAAGRWIARTDRGDVLRARFVCTGTGVLSKPRLPGIPGLAGFKGKSFHTSRWDFAYTGGDETGRLEGLKDKKVAIIGTGATGIQAIPHLAAWAKRLYVFQRTPSSVDIRANRPTDPEWYRGLEPGWQKRRMENFQKLILFMPEGRDDVGDRWTDVPLMVRGWMADTSGEAPDADATTLTQLADFTKMNAIRARIDGIVEDARTAAALKPWYNLWCKRPLFSDEYYQAFNRPNVTLVDTSEQPINRITESGIEVDGHVHDVDLIIYASGFELGKPTYEAGGYSLIGKGGHSLAEAWSEGQRSLHGMYTAGFPNLFMIGNILQASITLNFPHMLGEQAGHVAAMIARLTAEKIGRFEVCEVAQQAWQEVLAAKRVDRNEFDRNCTPGDYNNQGAPEGGTSLWGDSYGGGPFEYLALCKAWLADGFARDLILTGETEG